MENAIYLEHIEKILLKLEDINTILLNFKKGLINIEGYIYILLVGLGLILIWAIIYHVFKRFM